MKIYWTQKDIPELAPLPVMVRRQNYRDAFYMAGTHIEFWLGIGVNFLLVMCLFIVFDYVVPKSDTFPLNLIKIIFAIPAGILVWQQFAIYVMRKHYGHILTRNSEKNA